MEAVTDRDRHAASAAAARGRSVADIAGAVLLLAGTAVAWAASSGFPGEARVFPQLVMGMLAIAGAVWFAKAVRRSVGTHADAAPREGGRLRLVAIIALTLAYILAIIAIGYFVPTMIYIPAVAAILGSRAWHWIVLAAVLYCVSIYVVFVLLFARPVPLF